MQHLLGQMLELFKQALFQQYVETCWKMLGACWEKKKYILFNMC